MLRIENYPANLEFDFELAVAILSSSRGISDAFPLGSHLVQAQPVPIPGDRAARIWLRNWYRTVLNVSQTGKRA
jgi:hypothetical protein